MYRIARRFLHKYVLRPVVWRAFRLRVTGAGRLEREGPAIVVANHNSHIDTAVLLAAFPTRAIDRVRPVAAADYFLRNRLIAWFSTRIVGIVPIDRSGSKTGDPLAAARNRLAAGDMLILFPEGSRGEPGVMGRLRTGVGRLAMEDPSVPVIPVWLDGCDRAMPPGSRLPRRAACTARVGRPLFPRPGESVHEFTDRLGMALRAERRAA